MINFLVDFGLLAICIIAFTALMGTVLNVLGMKIFGGRQVDRFKNTTSMIQSGWKKVGGK